MTENASQNTLGVIVSEESMRGQDDSVLVSNNAVVNSMFSEHFTSEEISETALHSYYVDFYESQVSAGGFESFVRASEMNEDLLAYVREGLKEMGAQEHLDLFEKFLAAYGQLEPDAKEYLLDGDDDDFDDADVSDDYSDDDESESGDRAYEASRLLMEDGPEEFADGLEDNRGDWDSADGPAEVYEEDLSETYSGLFGDLDEEYESLSSEKDLEQTNADWLRAHPAVKPMPDEKIPETIASLADDLDDIDERRAEAELDYEDDLPEHEQLMVELAEVADQDFEEALEEVHVSFEEGEAPGWRFRTNEGEFVLVYDDERALMLEESGVVVAEIEFE